MRRRYRLLLVPPIAVALGAILYVGLLSVVPLLHWDEHEAFRLALSRGAAKAAGELLVAAGACFGAYRAFAYHPVWHVPYQQWLQTTPWHPHRPSPLQPLCLGWQDALLIAVLVLLAHRHPELHPADPVTAFGFSYLLVTTATLGAGGAPLFAVALLAVLPVVILPSVTGWWAVGVLAALYLIALLGTRRVLSKLAGTEPVTIERFKHLNGKEPAVGWPFKQLGPSDPPEAITLGSSMLLSVLVGWWAYAVCTRTYPPDLRPAWYLPQVGLMVAVPIAAARGLRYLVGYAPPIGLLGRLASGRLIIPGYDKVLVAPACVLLAGFELPRLLLHTPLGLIPSGAIVLTVSLFLATAIGPTVANWQLTGAHRLIRLKPAQRASVPRAGGQPTAA